VPEDKYRLKRAAFTAEPFAPAEVDAMRRHVRLADELRRSRYFAEQERRLHVTMDEGVMTSREMTLPDAGATRDMVAVLRQLYGDSERASFASMAALLRAHADPDSADGRRLLEVVDAFDEMRRRVLASWDLTGGQSSSPQPPSTVFLDWLYGEHLHSDAERAERIARYDHFRIYEWQFHWVAERLAALYTRFARLVDDAIGLMGAEQAS
jgi:hypothetical protein